MLLDHHVLPLSVSHHIVVLICQELITCKTCLYLVSPLVCRRIACIVKGMVHCLGVIHLIKVRHSLNREEDELEICITHLLRKSHVLSQCLGLKLDIFVRNLLPLSCLKIVCTAVKHFRCHASVVFAIKVEDSRSFSGLLLSELLAAEVYSMILEVLSIESLRIPCDVEEEGDRIFHRLEVSHVQHPETVDAI